MAIAFDAASNGGGVNPGTSISWSHTCTGTNRILFVGCRSQNTGGVTGITYNSVALTKINEAGADNETLWYLLNPTSGANNVVVTLGASQFAEGSSSSYTGVKQSAQPDSSNTRSATGTTSGNISTTIVAENSWTIATAKAASSAITGGVNATARTSVSGSTEHRILDSAGPLQPGSNTMNFTSAGAATWSEVIASFAPFVEPRGGSIAYFM